MKRDASRRKPGSRWRDDKVFNLSCAWIGLLLACAAAGAEDWVIGIVVGVHDGDTATIVTRDRRTLRVRFYGVDAPERATEDWPDQPYGRAAGRFMEKLLLKHKVRVRLAGERTYRREVGEVFVGGRSASRELLQAGYGWWNRKYAAGDLDLKQLEAAARHAKRGLWHAARPTPPWQYRNHYRRSRK